MSMDASLVKLGEGRIMTLMMETSCNLVNGVISHSKDAHRLSQMPYPMVMPHTSLRCDEKGLQLMSIETLFQKENIQRLLHMFQPMLIPYLTLENKFKVRSMFTLNKGLNVVNNCVRNIIPKNFSRY